MSRTITPERLDRYRQYIREGLSALEVNDREGTGLGDPSNTNKTLKRLADEMGVSREKLIPYDKPYGLTDDSKDMRFRLSYRLTDLLNKHSKEEVGRLTGVSSIRQNDAIKGEAGQPPFHNWTLAQIERLARALDIPFGQLLEDITLGYRKDRPWLQKRADQL